MSLAQGIHATYPDATANSPHIFDFTVARSAANDDLLEIWNGSTVAAIKAAIDKDGYLYSAAATAGDVPYFVTGGISNVRKMDYLNIGAANRVMTSSGTVPQWVTALTGLTSLGVDNLLVDGNTISSTSGALNLTPLAGQAIVLDEAINVDAGVVTGATSITSTAFVGALTGNADTATALETARTINGTSFDGTANITVTAPETLYTDVTASPTTGTSKETLMTYSVPADTLSTNGMGLRVTWHGLFAANTNNKVVGVGFQNDRSSSSGAFNNTGWKYTLTLMRRDDTTVLWQSTLTIGTVVTNSQSVEVTVSSMAANALSVYLYGTTGTQANDMTADAMIVELLRT